MKYIISEKQYKILEQEHSQKMGYQPAKGVTIDGTGEPIYPVFSCLEYEPITIKGERITPDNLPKDVGYKWNFKETVSGKKHEKEIKVIFHKYDVGGERKFKPWIEIVGFYKVEGYNKKAFFIKNLDNTFKCGENFKIDIKTPKLNDIFFKSKSTTVNNDGTFTNLPTKTSYNSLNDFGTELSKIQFNTAGLVAS